MDKRIENLLLRIRPAVYDLGGGERVRLHSLVGSGRHKKVYKLAGSNEVIKVLKAPTRPEEGSLLDEVRNEEILRELGIAFAPARRHDPAGRWLIKEHAPDPTIRQLAKARSAVLFTEALVSALVDVLHRLRRADAWMDMGTPNWILRRRDGRPYLVSLEPDIVTPSPRPWPWFEDTYLPMWLGVRPRRISARRHEALRGAWANDPRFAPWRAAFGPTLPALGLFWEIRD